MVDFWGRKFVCKSKNSQIGVGKRLIDGGKKKTLQNLINQGLQMLRSFKGLISATLTIVFALGVFFTVGVNNAKADAVISLQGDNGQYLSRILRNGIDAIEVAKPQLDPPFTQFKAILLPNLKVALQADNGKYLSRILRNGIDAIEAAKPQLDPPFTSFVLINLPDGKIALKADNGKYWSRIRRGSIDPVEAAKTEIDVFSQFKVVP
jgi:hypothetical protein